MELLRSIPIFVVARDLLQQRRIALSGDDAEARARDDAEEEGAMEAFKEECKEYVPELYGFSE
jgi:mediator of RNA polymerase II transcription subunit 12